jgi:hypothetical protein
MMLSGRPDGEILAGMQSSRLPRDRGGQIASVGGNGATALRRTVDIAGGLAKEMRLVCL